MMLLCAPPMWPDLAWSDCILSFPIWNLENPCSAKLAFCLTSGTLESPAPHLLWGDLKSDQQCLRLWKVSFCLKWELLCDEPVSFRAVPFNFFCGMQWRSAMYREWTEQIISHSFLSVQLTALFIEFVNEWWLGELFHSAYPTLSNAAHCYIVFIVGTLQYFNNDIFYQETPYFSFLFWLDMLSQALCFCSVVLGDKI